jgi:hypothetical protein
MRRHIQAIPHSAKLNEFAESGVTELTSWTVNEISLAILVSKEHIPPGRIAVSEWTRSITAVSDIPVAQYSGAGANATCQVAYCPPIVVLLSLLALSVSYCK